MLQGLKHLYLICAKRFLKFDKEEAAFLIISFGSLNTSAMVVAICNMTCTLIAHVQPLVATRLNTFVVFVLLAKFHCSLASRAYMILTMLCMAEIRTPQSC